jgi:hypothetical protein
VILRAELTRERRLFVQQDECEESGPEGGAVLEQRHAAEIQGLTEN